MVDFSQSRLNPARDYLRKMRIVFVTSPPNPIPGWEPGALPQEAVRQLSELHPEHDWFVLEGMPRPGAYSFFKRRKNMQQIRLLRPDVVLYATLDNMEVFREIPVMVVITEPAGRQPPSVEKAMTQLTTIITDSVWLKNDLQQSFALKDSQLKVIKLMSEDIQPEWHNRLLTREKYTTGNDYFFYSGPIGADGKWQQVLHAFSKFKKWQQSSLWLVLTGAVDPGYSLEFHGLLDAYKYRQEVAWLNEVDAMEKKHLADAAFATLADGRRFAGRMDILHSFRAGIPVICEEHPLTQQFAGDAVLYADWKTPVLSQHMIDVYKKEELSNQLTEKGKQLAEQYSWQQSLDELYNCIVASAKS
jgi:glycosyltransferase involved in cell wall biosynthesis